MAPAPSTLGLCNIKLVSHSEHEKMIFHSSRMDRVPPARDGSQSCSTIIYCAFGPAELRCSCNAEARWVQGARERRLPYDTTLNRLDKLLTSGHLWKREKQHKKEDRNLSRMWIQRRDWLLIGQPTDSAKEQSLAEGGEREVVSYLECAFPALGTGCYWWRTGPRVWSSEIISA